MTAAHVDVSLPNHRYRITVHPGRLGDLPGYLAGLTIARHTVVISDEKVARLYGASVVDGLAKAGFATDLLTVPAGEKSKSTQQAAVLWQQLADCKAERSTLIIALGGGVVGDLAGFVASTYKRGVPVLQIPTTLMAQVDSSIGGKTGINLPTLKNAVGSFWQPIAVLIDPHVLQTLDDANYRSGLAEVIKYGFTLQPHLLQLLKSQASGILAREPKIVQQMILHACQCKTAIVAADERETSGERAKLNYGHTLGHAIESLTEYGDYLHGEAVAVGMCFAAVVANRRKMIEQAVVEEHLRLLSQYGLPTKVKLPDAQALLEVMSNDKKAERGSIGMILLEAVGAARLVHGISSQELLDAMAHISL